MSPDPQQLTRIEAMMRAILDSIEPLMTFGEVMRLLKYKSKHATRRWLKAQGIQKSGNGYRRVDVIAAVTKAKL